MARFLSILFLLFLAGGLRAQDSTLLARADTLLVHWKWKAAKKIYDQVIAKGGGKARTYYTRAVCERWLGEKRSVVIGDLTEALRLDPKLYAAWMLRADRYAENLMFDRAIEDLTSAIGCAGDTAHLFTAYLERGTAYYHVRSFDRSVDDLSTCIRMDSTRYSALGRLSNTLDEMGRSEEAIRMQERYVELVPDDFTGYMNTGFMLAKGGRYAEALDWYGKAFEHGGSTKYQLWNNQGYAKYKLGDLDGALKDIRRSLKMRSWNSYAYRNLALVYLAQGRNNEACTALEKALSWGFTKEYGNEVKQLYDTHCK